MLIRLLARYLRSYIPLLLTILLAQVVAVIASLTLPTLNAKIIDNGVAQGDTDYIWMMGAVMLAVAATQVIGQGIAVYAGARAAMGFGRDVRAGIFDRGLTFSTREVRHFGAASLITRNTNDVQQVQMVVLMAGTIMISAPLTAIGGVVMALREDLMLSWSILAAVAVLGIVVGVLVSFMAPLFKRNQKEIDRLNSVTREQISGIRVIRAFVREDSEAVRFDDANSSLMRLNLKIGGLFAGLFPAVLLILYVSQIAVMWFGGIRVDSGDLQVGQLTAFITYLMQILISVMMATMMVMMIPRAAVCAGRIMEVLRTDSAVVWKADGVTDTPEEATVRMEHVTFSYPGAEEAVLADINFEMKPKTTTAIIGSTGCGKSTLVGLLPRLFDVTEGGVYVDGVNVRDIDPDTLYRKIGWVPQKPYLFSGTIASNLRYGNPDATEEEMWEALRVAQADFVHDLEDGLDAPIAQGGTNVSGGQRQRLSIARALVKKPEIYVFDDAFSALDVATDARLRAELANYTGDATVLIVAQRISSIRDADQIVVLNRGRVEAIGTHAELLTTSQTYREIALSQRALSDEELALLPADAKADVSAQTKAGASAQVNVDASAQTGAHHE